MTSGYLVNLIWLQFCFQYKNISTEIILKRYTKYIRNIVDMNKTFIQFSSRSSEALHKIQKNRPLYFDPVHFKSAMKYTDWKLFQTKW